MEVYGPVLITGAFALLGAWVSVYFGRKRSEHTKLENSRSTVRVYDDYADACRKMIRELGGTPPEWPASLKEDK